MKKAYLYIGALLFLAGATAQFVHAQYGALE
ncbi:MAG: hypothetical protein G01um10148_963 [Parcubacteria group bacterium Gr01-1014_8]|nr:MAG: hypothetical protein G01um10148_963 [Parcubacteria group bacterium Gr01-1014_8]